MPETIKAIYERVKAEAGGKAVNSKKLTWDELADLYDKQTGRHARTCLMEDVFKWAERQPDKFYVDDDDVLCQIS